MGVETELWEQCRDWLILVGALEDNVRISQLKELGAALKDGVRLCRLANILNPGCIENSTYVVVSDSSFWREKNITKFLTACRDAFNLNETNLFAPSDLEQFEQFKNVLKTISVLSHTNEAVSKGFAPFPETISPLHSYSENNHDDIYCNLGREVETIDDKIYDAIQFMNNDEQDEKIYDRIVVQSKSIDDIWETFKPETKREHQIKELLDTETRYVKNCLEMLMRDYYAHLKPIMQRGDFELIFGNLAEIYRIHQSFHSNLRRAVLITLGLAQRTVVDQNITIGNVFLNTKKEFLAYADYCAQMKTAREHLDKIEKEDGITGRKIKELTDKQRANAIDGSIFSLQDYLSVPFQRICKYHLILKNIIENTTVDDPDRLILLKSLESCEDIVNYVNEAKRDYELKEVILSIERSIDGIEKLYNNYTISSTERPDFQMYGRLKLDGPIKLTDSKENGKQKQRYIFIFERVVLICKKMKNSRFDFKSAFKIADYRIEDNNNDLNNSIQQKPTNTLSRKWTQTFFDNVCLTLIKNSEESKDEHRVQIFLKSLQQRELWRNKMQEVLDRNNPPEGRLRHHELIYTSFTKPENCTVCQKLLLGKFYQGYHCKKCCKYFHYDCLSTAYCRRYDILLEVERYVALRTVKTEDPHVLAFEKGDEIHVFKTNQDGTLLGRRASIPGVSGLISRETVRKLSQVYNPPQNNRISTTSMGAVTPQNNDTISLGNKYISETICNLDFDEGYEPWYFGQKDRQQANELLNGHLDGTFIVRLSPNEHKFVLSVTYQQACKHMKIEKMDDKYYLHDGRLFDSIKDLIKYYRQNSLSEGFDKIDTKLTGTLIKARMFRVTQDYKHHSMGNAKYLELRIGDQIELVDTTGDDKGWWRFQAGDKTGFFPLSYVSAVDDDENDDI